MNIKLSFLMDTLGKLFLFYLTLFFTTNLCAQSASTVSNVVLSSAEVNFEFGKHDLRAADIVKLEQVLSLLESNEYIILRITAHTDAIGSDENNQVLSQKRGQAVQSFLISKGVPDSLVQVSVYGESAPVAENDSDFGRSKNRRATIEVIQQQVIAPPVAQKADVKMGLIEGNVIDKKSGEPIQATVVIRSKTFQDSVHTNDQGYFQKEVPVNTVVGVDVYAPGYFFETQMMKVQDGLKLPTLTFQLPPAEVGEVALIKDLFFKGNQAVLLKKSEPVLPKVLAFMEINNTITIEIGGHVNFPYTYRTATRKAGKFEQELSDKRAKLVYDFLLENGISKKRLTWKGYSNTQMKFPKTTVERQMAQNRRVEIKIIAK